MSERVVVSVEFTWRSTLHLSQRDLDDADVTLGDFDDNTIPTAVAEMVNAGIAELVDWDVHLNMQKGPDHE